MNYEKLILGLMLLLMLWNRISIHLLQERISVLEKKSGDGNKNIPTISADNPFPVQPPERRDQ